MAASWNMNTDKITIYVLSFRKILMLSCAFNKSK